MKVYWLIFTQTLQRAFASRLKICTWGFISAFSPIVMLVIFSTYYASGRTISGYDFKTLISYYVSVVFISVWVSKVAANVAPDIKEGNLSNFVIKPLNYILYRIPWELAWYSISAIFMGIPLVLLILMGYQEVVFYLINKLFANFLLFIPSLFMGYLISYFMSMTIGFVGFFTTETTGFENTYDAVFELFSGKLIPLIFFPIAMIGLVKILPFGYIVYFPSQVLIGNISGTELFRGFMLQGFWVIVTYLICKIFWIKGIKKFSAIGL